MRAFEAPYLKGYAFLGVLGHGATSSVFRYRQFRPERDVAVKFCTQASSETSRKAFLAEADIMASLSWHPHVLTMYATGATADGVPYLVLEYAPGGSYRSVLDAGPLAATRVLDVGIKLAGALYAAHHAGVLHRDVKPGNVLVTAAGQPALTDFGVSASKSCTTASGYSPLWAAPEVCDGASQGSIAADIYSLGSMLLALLTGTTPRASERTGGAVGRPQPERTAAPAMRRLPECGTSSSSSAVCRRELMAALRDSRAGNPDDRPASALVFARRLQWIQERHIGRVTPFIAVDVPAYASGAAAPSRAAATAARPVSKRHPHISVPVAPVLCCILLFAGLCAVTIEAADGPAGLTSTGLPRGMRDPPMARADGRVPSPQHVNGIYEGDMASFTCTNPDPREGDRYAWDLVDDGGGRRTSLSLTDEPAVRFEAGDDAQICVEVSIVRKDRSMSEVPAFACATRR